MRAQTRSAVERHLDTSVDSIQSVAGGDINQAFRLQLADSRTVFVKTNSSVPSDFFVTESRGLQWLKSPGVVTTPKVLGQSSAGEPAFLILEWLHSREPSSDFDERLGYGLAQLHRSHPAQFGLDHNNYIGTLRQGNKPRPQWSQFYAEQRLHPQLLLAIENKRLSTGCIQAVEAVIDRLDSILAPEEPPARLHGDLWSGNVHIGPRGGPVFIDPAVYGGHREIDIAMMKLFGGFKARTFEAYNATYPLEADWEARIELHQLYPLLVHVNLFGGHYAQSVERIAKRYL